MGVTFEIFQADGILPVEKLLKWQASRPQVDEQHSFSIVAKMPSGPDAVLCLRCLMAFITSVQSHLQEAAKRHPRVLDDW